MAHHYSDPDLVPEGIKKEIETKLEGLKLGATGQYPHGKLNEHDEGEIAFAVAADPVSKKVLINFGKPVAFLGMTTEQAAALAHLLIQKALEVGR